MADLATLQHAKLHLRLNGTTEHDGNLRLKLEEASAMVVSWLKNYIGDSDTRATRYAVIDAWTVESVPLEVRSAVLRLTGHLFYLSGGDDPKLSPKLMNGDLPEDVTMFLKRLRDPAIA